MTDDPRFTKAFKALGAGVSALLTYLIGVGTAEGGLGDLSLLQWLGAVLFVLASYGITYTIPNPKVETT